jgi:hypothetical protein
MPLTIFGKHETASPSMLQDPKQRRIVLAAAGGVAVAFVAGWLSLQDSIFRMAVTPPGHFATWPAPSQPDYAKPESWALRPSQPTAGGWEKPWGVDIFLVHPTSAYAGDNWNAAIDDKVSTDRLMNRILPNQAGPFLQAGPVYAPRYRQAALHSEIDVGGEGNGAFLLAYGDVLASFDHYIANDNRSRGIILVGVGQGGLYAQKLLADRFQDQPLQERLAVAYIIDAALPADAPEKMFIQPVCADRASIQCVVAWKSIVSGEGEERFRDDSPVWTVDGKIAQSKGRKLVCVNPLLWTAGQEMAPRTDHRGGAKASGLDDANPQILPQTVSARCQDGVLSVERPSAPELQASGEWGGRYKTPEYNLFYADIVANASERARAASAWLDEYGHKPAEPLPPALTLDDSPIHRPGGEPEPVPAPGSGN